MSTNVNPIVLNPVNVNEDLARTVSGALNPADIRAAIIAEAERQTGATLAAATAQQVADQAAADARAADEAGAGFSRVETIGGKEFTFEADTELELERMVNNALKVAYSLQRSPELPEPDETATTIATNQAAAQKKAEEDVAARAELELQFRRGDITTADYIERSGAMADYLAKQGVPLESLKEVIDLSQNAQETQSWADATEEFLNGPVGSDWPGGDKNLRLIGEKLIVLGLVDATDKIAALAQAYEAMKQTGTIFPYEAPVITETTIRTAPVTETQRTPTVTQSTQHLQQQQITSIPSKQPSTSSSMFGRSSGVSETSRVTNADPNVPQYNVDSNATPQQIMEAWKQQQVQAGKNPNDAFVETFAARRT